MSDEFVSTEIHARVQLSAVERLDQGASAAEVSRAFDVNPKFDLTTTPEMPSFGLAILRKAHQKTTLPAVVNEALRLGLKRVMSRLKARIALSRTWTTYRGACNGGRGGGAVIFVDYGVEPGTPENRRQLPAGVSAAGAGGLDFRGRSVFAHAAESL